MKVQNFILVILLTFISISSIGQTLISGVVLDDAKNAILPYVNIGIRHKNIGTNSHSDGTFSMTIPQQNESDTLTFSMVGYSELNVPIMAIIATQQKTFHLHVKANQIEPVFITAPKLKSRDFGINNTSSLIHFTDGSTNQNDIFEIAQLIKSDTNLSKITSVNLYINESRTDSGIFRINFYGFEGNRPVERIVDKNIIQTKEIKEGWLKFDLSDYNIYVKGKFVVAIEFIPNVLKSKQIYYEIKLGGSAKSFVRTSSQGEWVIPPHHYRMFITALVTDGKNGIGSENSDEKESIPSNTLFSQSVRDSFSIFVHLPEKYNNIKNRHFPVIYLLDANAYFDIVADAMKESKSNAILVGIGYKDFITMDSLRNRDYTYPEASPQDSFPISGGANRFFSFIRDELIPFVDKSFNTDTTNRTLMGHSLGGYFTLYALMKTLVDKNNLFKNYVAASPSLEYFDNYLLEQFTKMKDTYIQETKKLYITYGGNEDSEDGGTGTAGMDNFNSFVSLISKENFRKITVKSQIFPRAVHMETAVPTFTNTIKELK